MASVDSNYMRDCGLHELCKQMCQSILANPYNSDGTELKYLLPAKTLYLMQGAIGNFPFTNRLTNEEFDYDYEGEEERVVAVNKINRHIKDYNKQLKEEEKRLDQEIGIERRVMKLKVYPAYEYPVWGVNVQCEVPVYKDHWKKDNVWEKTIIDIRNFSNEIVYKKLHVPQTIEECVAKFNKMIHEYLEEMVGDNELSEEDTLYYPLKEFRDYMMRTNATDTNLLLNDVKKPQLLPTSVYDEVLIHNSLGKSKTNPDVVPDYDGGSYSLTIDAQELMLTLKTEKGKKKVSFREAGFSAVKGINRYLKLLTYYAMYQAEIDRLYKAGKPVTEIELAQAWQEYVGRMYPNKNTLSTYHGKLKQHLNKLLHLNQVDTEILSKHSSKIQTVDGTQKHTWYRVNINLIYKKTVATSYRETIKEGKGDKSAEEVYHAELDKNQLRDWQTMEREELDIEQ